eukprot:COSAG05_NODE_15498_length_368_cov_0.579926_1_plen_122_part_11
MAGDLGITMATSDGPISISSVQNSSLIAFPVQATNFSGLNDLSVSGYYTGSTSGTIQVKINDLIGGTDSFSWRFVATDSDSGEWSSSISITAGHAVLLAAGVYVTFAHNTNHGGSELWYIAV